MIYIAPTIVSLIIFIFLLDSIFNLRKVFGLNQTEEPKSEKIRKTSKFELFMTGFLLMPIFLHILAVPLFFIMSLFMWVNPLDSILKLWGEFGETTTSLTFTILMCISMGIIATVVGPKMIKLENDKNKRNGTLPQ